MSTMSTPVFAVATHLEGKSLLKETSSRGIQMYDIDVVLAGQRWNVGSQHGDLQTARPRADRMSDMSWRLHRPPHPALLGAHVLLVLYQAIHRPAPGQTVHSMPDLSEDVHHPAGWRHRSPVQPDDRAPDRDSNQHCESVTIRSLSTRCRWLSGCKLWKKSCCCCIYVISSLYLCYFFIFVILERAKIFSLDCCLFMWHIICFCWFLLFFITISLFFSSSCQNHYPLTKRTHAPTLLLFTMKSE